MSEEVVEKDEMKCYDVNIKQDDSEEEDEELDLRIRPVKVNLKKYDFRFPIDGMF